MDDGLPVVGVVGGIGLPFDLNEPEQEEAAAELALVLARKRPAGFAAWPEDNQAGGER